MVNLEDEVKVETDPAKLISDESRSDTQCSHQDFALRSPSAPSVEKQGSSENIKGTKLLAAYERCEKNSL